MPILVNKTDPDAPNARFEKPSPLLIGSADDADLKLIARGVSGHHCWIERHHDGFHLVDLRTTNGSYVNGKKVAEILLQHGDVLRLGKAELEFRVTDAEQNELSTSAARQGEPSKLIKLEAEPPAPAPSTAIDIGGRCAQCGAAIPSGSNFCARCGLPINAVARPIEQFVQPVEGPHIRGPGILPMLALICGLVGPLLIGIGWLLGIILGLMALGIIRRTGGFERDRRQALWGVGAGVAWAVIGFVGIGSWWWIHTAEERRASLEKQIAENEQAVLIELTNLARAEKYAKAILFADANHNSIGEYLRLDQVEKMESPFVNPIVAQRKAAHGYTLATIEASEAQFFAVGTPQRYGRTGRRTFGIDQTGVLRGKDARGASFPSPSQLPPLQLPNAFEKVDDEIAEDALAVARSTAKAGDYEKSRVILDNIRQHFTLTKAAKQLTDLEKTIDPFLVEARADQKYREAQMATQRGDLLLAIALLRDVEMNYSTFSKIHEATKQRQGLEVQYAQAQEDKAKALFEKAEALERDGKMGDAETIYFQIEKGFPDTEWAKQVLSVKPELHRQLREKQVEGWLAQLASLSPETDYVQILNLAEQLKRNYSDTETVQKATDTQSELQSLTILVQKATAQKLKVEAMKDVQAGQPRRALTTLEKAITEKPDLTVHLRETLWDLYPRVAERALKEHDLSGAMASYESFLKLNPPESKLDRQLFSDLSYQVAHGDLLGGRPEAALPRLQQAEAVYRADPEFNALYGRTLARLGKYEDSVERFDAAVTSGAQTNSLFTTLYFWRAWTRLHWAEQLEAKLRDEARLPTLKEVVTDMERARTERSAGPSSNAGSSTNQPVQTNLTIRLVQETFRDEDTENAGITTNVFETLLNGSLELVADIEAARIDLSRQDVTSRGKSDKVEISSRFERAQTIQKFRDRISKLRQLLLGQREKERVVAEDLSRLIDGYDKARGDLQKAAQINEIKNPLLAQNARLVSPRIAERAHLYKQIVPALIRVHNEDLKIAETSLDLAEQAANQLQWNLKGGISISKTVEENFRRIGTRKALDEAVAAFHRFDEKKLDLSELWRRNSLPEP